jgi:hypothetical protein
MPNICKHPDTRFIHLTLKECSEADCANAQVQVCDLVICVDCGGDVNG